MKLQLKLWQKGIIIVALPLVCELVFVSVLGSLLMGVEVEARATERSRNIVLEAEQMERIFFQAGAALVGYQASKNPLFELQYQQACKRIAAQMEVLDRLCKNSPRQKAELVQINQHISKGIEILDNYKLSIDRDDLVAARGENNEISEAMALGATLGKIISNEKESEIHRPQEERHLRQLVEQCLIAGVALNIVIAFAISIYFSRGITRRLLIVGANSERLAQRQELLPPVPGSDEIAQVDTIFHRMADTLLRAEALRKEVLDMVTHDLRTPLASIELSLDMLQQGHRGALTEATRDELEKIHRNSSRLMRLINDLLDMEKLKEGKLRIAVKEVNLELVVENAFDTVSSIAKQRNISLEQRNTDFDIFADGIRMTQVLVNLLSNALKFSPEKSAIIVEASKTETEVIIKVIDQGPGMSSEQAASLFQRFSQLEGHIQQGSGLGLAICKALVELHHGQIGVDSELTKGSTFWVKLPLNPPTKE